MKTNEVKLLKSWEIFISKPCMVLENIKRRWFRTHTAQCVLMLNWEFALDSSYRRITAFCPDIVGQAA